METPTPEATAPRSASRVEADGRRIIVYSNSLGDIVIRQSASGHGEKLEDDVIIVRKVNVPSLIDALGAESIKVDSTDGSA